MYISFLIQGTDKVGYFNFWLPVAETLSPSQYQHNAELRHQQLTEDDRIKFQKMKVFSLLFIKVYIFLSGKKKFSRILFILTLISFYHYSELIQWQNKLQLKPREKTQFWQHSYGPQLTPLNRMSLWLNLCKSIYLCIKS